MSMWGISVPKTLLADKRECDLTDLSCPLLSCWWIGSVPSPFSDLALYKSYFKRKIERISKNKIEWAFESMKYQGERKHCTWYQNRKGISTFNICSLSVQIIHLARRLYHWCLLRGTYSFTGPILLNWYCQLFDWSIRQFCLSFCTPIFNTNW